MFLLMLAAALPGLYWEQGPETAEVLKKAGVECIQVAPAKVDAWRLESDKLSCYVYDAQKKKSKQGADFVVIKHNGSVNGKDVAFCFHDKLFECLLASKGHRSVLFVDLGQYIGIADVISDRARVSV